MSLKQDVGLIVEFARGDQALPLLMRRNVVKATPHTTKTKVDADRLLASAERVYAGRGLTKGPQRHNEIVAMRIGQADALRGKAYAIQRDVASDSKRSAFLAAVKDRNGDPTMRKEAARLTRRARNPALKEPTVAYYSAGFKPVEFARGDYVIGKMRQVKRPFSEMDARDRAMISRDVAAARKDEAGFARANSRAFDAGRKKYGPGGFGLTTGASMQAHRDQLAKYARSDRQWLREGVQRMPDYNQRLGQKALAKRAARELRKQNRPAILLPHGFGKAKVRGF